MYVSHQQQDINYNITIPPCSTIISCITFQHIANVAQYKNKWKKTTWMNERRFYYSKGFLKVVLVIILIALIFSLFHSNFYVLSDKNACVFVGCSVFSFQEFGVAGQFQWVLQLPAAVRVLRGEQCRHLLAVVQPGSRCCSSTRSSQKQRADSGGGVLNR